MTEKEVEDVLNELYEVRPEMLDDKAKRLFEAIMKIADEKDELKEKYKRLSIEAQATAFDDKNVDTEGLLRVLLKQGEITLDEKGYYQRERFDWEENLWKLGLMKKREKNFYIPDDECLDEYTKQLESQLKEYNEIKETFRKYCVMHNDTLYDGCCKMQDEIEELKETLKCTQNSWFEDTQKIEEMKKQIDLDNECEIALNNKIMDLEKEIEELKDNNKQKYYHVVKSKELEEEINNAWENKIKAKIQEYKKPVKFKEIDEYGEIIEGTMVYQDKIEVLQELLEERN
ncbi:MAG: hypothetical protein II393_00045 [Cytophagales bacterium]|nr:hypothetical protein [Cytophagales bacterium]